MTEDECIDRYKKATAVRDHLQAQLAATEQKVIEADALYLYAVQAREVLNTVAKQTQRNLEARLSTIVTMALSAVFPEPYEFKVCFEERRNQIEADLLLVKNGEVCSPLDAVGGGVLDVVAFALRISALLMQAKRRVIIMDEPFKHLSANYQPKAIEMMRMLGTKLDVQFIIVSHENSIIEGADKVFNIRNGALVEEQ